MSSELKPKSKKYGTIPTNLSSSKHFYVYQNSKIKTPPTIELNNHTTFHQVKKMTSEKIGFRVRKIFNAITGEEIQSTHHIQRLPDLSLLQVTNGEIFIPHPKVYRSDTQGSSNEPESPHKNCESIDDKRYIVQDLLERYWNSQIRQHCYLVRWKNYPPDCDTWEPEENLIGTCQHLIDKFEGNSQPKANTRLTCSNLDNLKITIKEESSSQEQPVYCVCRTSLLGFMVQCDKCKEWFHGDCVGFDESELNAPHAYCCEKCKGVGEVKSNFKVRATTHNNPTRAVYWDLSKQKCKM